MGRPRKWFSDIMGEKVLQGSIIDEKLSIEYGEVWESYLHRKDYPEFKEMVATLNGKLARGGKGEGKSGGGFEGESKGKFKDEQGARSVMVEKFHL